MGLARTAAPTKVIHRQFRRQFPVPCGSSAPCLPGPWGWANGARGGRKPTGHLCRKPTTARRLPRACLLRALLALQPVPDQRGKGLTGEPAIEWFRPARSVLRADFVGMQKGPRRGIRTFRGRFNNSVDNLGSRSRENQRLCHARNTMKQGLVI
jgi:hypothetical protein